MRLSRITSLLIGVVLGFTGVILHDALPPLGFILALLITFMGIKLVGQQFGTRSSKVWAAIGWFAVFARAAISGTSYELLIYGNAIGNLYLFTGFATLLISVVWKVR